MGSYSRNSKVPHPSFRNTYYGLTSRLASNETRALVRGAHQPFYWVRQVHLARIVEQRIEIPDRMENFELKTILRAHSVLSDDGMLREILHSSDRSPGLCDDNHITDIERRIAELLIPEGVPLSMIGQNFYWSVDHWTKRDYSLVRGNLKQDIVKKGFQPARAILLWQNVMDLQRTIESGMNLEDPALGFFMMLNGHNHARLADASESVMSKYPLQVMKVSSGEYSVKDLETLINETESIGKLNLNSCRPVGALLVTKSGMAFAGHNGPPLWDGFSTCTELMSGCIRHDAVMPNKLGSDAALRGNRPDHRRSNCGEMAAMGNALYEGFSLAGSTLFSRWAPCNLCTKMAYELGVGNIVYAVDYSDINTEKILLTIGAGITHYNGFSLISLR